MAARKKARKAAPRKPARKTASRKKKAARPRKTATRRTPALTRALKDAVDAIVQVALALTQQEQHGESVGHLGHALKNWGKGDT